MRHLSEDPIDRIENAIDNALRGRDATTRVPDDKRTEQFALLEKRRTARSASTLGNLLDDRVGTVFRPYIHPHFEDQDGIRILVVRCEPGPKPAFLKDGAQQRFFVRGGNANAELNGDALHAYLKQRFP